MSQGSGGGNGYFGRIKLYIDTVESNTGQMIDMDIHNQQWVGGICATVNYSSTFGFDAIKKIRLSKWVAKDNTYTSANSESRDPIMAIDIFIDDLTNEDQSLKLSCYSWGGIKFLRIINVDVHYPILEVGEM
jgi:hypothetical protein